MATLNTRPESVDIMAYAGDTLTVRITAPSTLTTGMTWHAGIKSKRSATVDDATFAITPPTVAGGPAYLVLSGSESLRLLGITATSQRATKQQYIGEWDCQISSSDTDPIRTLVQGKITIILDVTRTP